MDPSVPNQCALNFPTGTKFHGTFNELGMQGYGLYTYPDGTKYLGQFQNNRFHGCGTIEIPQPHCVCFSVVHNNGKLTKISEMSFSDSLMVKFNIKDDKMNFDCWDYCSAEDRRFCAEKLSPLEPVGPSKYQTKDGPEPPPLGRNIFDLGFGMLNEYGFLTNVPDHVSERTNFYVGCRDVRRWIRENCRHGHFKGKHLKQEVLSKFARQIIRNNEENAEDLISVALATSPLHKSRICRRSRSEDSSCSAKQALLYLGSTSDSCSSVVPRRVRRENTTVITKGCAGTKPNTRRSVSETHVCRIN